VWDIVCDPSERGPAYLLAAAGLDRQQAGNVLLALAAQPVEETLVRQVALFETLDKASAMRPLSLWVLDPAYRRAVLRLSEAAGA
jgi:hypothetical protein